MLKINVPLLALIAGLILLARQQQGYLGGLGQILTAVGLMGLGTLLNLILIFSTKGSRIGYLVAFVLYGALFFLFMYSFGQSKSLKPGG